MFELAARLRGERTAGLPLVLDRPVDPERDHVRFGAGAPMTLVEYGDFECPFCGKATGVIRELHERFGDDLRYVFRHLPLQDVHDHAELAAQAAEAAGAQGRFWEYHDLLFHHQDQLEGEDLLGYAADLDLDVERFARELAEGVHAERVRRTWRAPRPAAPAGRRPSSSASAAISGRTTPTRWPASSRPVALDPRPRLGRSGARVRAGTRWRLPRHAVHGKMCGSDGSGHRGRRWRGQHVTMQSAWSAAPCSSRRRTRRATAACRSGRTIRAATGTGPRPAPRPSRRSSAGRPGAARCPSPACRCATRWRCSAARGTSRTSTRRRPTGARSPTSR